MARIDLQNITVTYRSKSDTVTALDRCSAAFEEGKFHVIVGYSGCGKTTLLKTIAGLLPYDGTLTFDGADVRRVSQQDRNLAYVSQQYTLYPRMTVFDNIAFPLKAKHMPCDEIIEEVRSIADRLQLTLCLTRKPKHLSGGQQQRVALARALVRRPSVCLLDEPFSNLDTRLRAEERQLVREVLAGSTVLYVTHDVEEAMGLADTVTVMDEGKVTVQGTPSEVFSGGDRIAESLMREARYIDREGRVIR